MHCLVAETVWQMKTDTGSEALPVSAVTVMVLSHPDIARGDRESAFPAPGERHLDDAVMTMPLLGAVAAKAITSSTGVAENCKSIMLSPTKIGA